MLAANGNDPVFRLTPVPKADRNNFQPRVGFNWVPRTSDTGLVGLLTGGDRLSLRGGYARTHDYAFLNIALNIASSFPFVAAITRSNLANAFTALQNTPAGVPAGTDPNLLTRTVVAEDFRSPLADQFSLEIQRQLGQNLALRIGYVGTFGKDLFQTLDGNPRPEFCGTSCTTRLDPTRGVIRLRANTAKSWYHSMQTGLEKRLSHGLSAALHYTWSRYIDTASDIFNPSTGEVAVAQDSFDIGARQRTLVLRPPAPAHRQLRLGAAGHAVAAGNRREDPRRLAGGLLLHVPERRAVHAAQRIRSNGGAVGDRRPRRQRHPAESQHQPRSVEDDDPGDHCRRRRGRSGSLFRRLCGMPSATCPGERVGNAPRNLLRADGIGNVDFSLIKNTRFANGHNLQIRVEMFNATNTRNFGIPDSRVNSADFLNQWATDGGGRRIWAAVRYTF